jgi:hypothetical protein
MDLSRNNKLSRSRMIGKPEVRAEQRVVQEGAVPLALK